MTLPVNPNIAATEAPPVMEARRWLAETRLPEGLPLLNLSQAAPVAPPPLPLREAIADIALHDPSAHLYGPVLGLPALREQLAADWSAAYGGTIAGDDVAITSGCNQAFAAAIAALAGPGDAVMLVAPWYFNHHMWLTMQGIEARVLPAGPDLLPDPDRARALVTPNLRAIVLVTPNNPGGVEYPPSLVAAFAALAREKGLALVVDETYRDFDSRPGPPHDLFADPDWREVLVHLYSFSKAYRLTGHRVGAMVAGPRLLAEAEKFLDTVTICPNQIGQRAALWGMRNLASWLAGERAEILRRRRAVEEELGNLPGWRLVGAGAYFAWVEHPFDAPSDRVARALLQEAGLLVLPGTMFAPRREDGGDGTAERGLRIAFANADAEGIAELGRRLRGFSALPRR